MTASHPSRPRRALVLGHLSTVGDLEVLDWATARLVRLGIPHDVSAFRPGIRAAEPRWVDARLVDPRPYTHLLVVCGPFGPTHFAEEADLLARFAHCAWIGLNLTMVAPLDRFDPFDALLERDSDRIARPDLSLAQTQPRRPVVGLCFAGNQPEYGDRQLHGPARRRLRALARRAGAAPLELDTKWPASRNANGFRSPAEFESVLARVDVLLTTRLHGLALALKNGVPVVALDAIRGGDKVLRQARALGWTEAFPADAVTDADLDAALARCLAPDARDRALACARAAAQALAPLDEAFAAALDAPPGPRDLPPPATLRWRRLRVLAEQRLRSLRR